MTAVFHYHLAGNANSSSAVSRTREFPGPRFFKSARVKGSAIIKGRILARASKLLEDDKCAATVA